MAVLFLRITDKPNNDLKKLLGNDQVKLLTFHYQHVVITVPRCTKVFQNIRDNEIMTEKRNGKKLSDLAITYQLTEMGICLALRRAEKLEYKQRLKSSNSQTIK
jgi:Mor family transcriptional regulator